MSLLTGKWKPNVPLVELREEVPTGELLEMMVAGTARAEEPIDCPQEACPRATTSTTWDEAHLLRLTVPKGKTDQVNKIVTTSTGLWRKTFRTRQENGIRERRAGEDEVWLRLGYEGGVGDHGSEGFRVEGERWLITRCHLGLVLVWAFPRDPREKNVTD